MARAPFAASRDDLTTDRPSRRAVLRTGLAAFGAAVAGSALASPAVVSGAGDPWSIAAEARSLTFVHARTGERFDGVYFEQGRYLDDALARLDWVLRDVNRDEARTMDNRLVDLLSAVQTRIGSTRELIVTSAYRTKRTNDLLRLWGRGAALNSLHIEGQAADFHVPGLSPRTLARLVASLRMGGVGVYDGGHFVHGDVGEIRYWRG